MLKELELPLFSPAADLASNLKRFKEFGTATGVTETRSSDGRATVPTAAHRDANNLHEVSNRACFKPQLPRFFIERLTSVGDVVYDPFMGRGTTLLEASLMGRIPCGNDINPLSLLLIKPRLQPPTIDSVDARLDQIAFDTQTEIREDLLVFYHIETLRQLSSLRS